jgi:hypothetical protein
VNGVEYPVGATGFMTATGTSAGALRQIEEPEVVDGAGEAGE